MARGPVLGLRNAALLAAQGARVAVAVLVIKGPCAALQGALDMLDNTYIRTGGTDRCFKSHAGGHGGGSQITLTQVAGLWCVHAGVRPRKSLRMRPPPCWRGSRLHLTAYV